MTGRGLLCVLAGGVVLGAPSAALGVTLVGQYDQGGQQGVDSTQAGVQSDSGPGATVPGAKYVLGSATGTENQNSTNVAANAGVIGGPGSAGTMIANGSQENQQGINSAQGAKKGNQNSTNVEASAMIVGLPDAGDTVLGPTSQVNGQAENSHQLLAGGKSGGAILFTGPTGGHTNQNSTNAEISAQVILG